jgi:transglutaminase-like putative cysteine protease
MRICAGYDIAFECTEPTASLLLLKVHPDRAADLESEDKVEFSRPVISQVVTDVFGNRMTKCVLPAGRTALRTRFIIRDSGQPDVPMPAAPITPVQNIPADALQFLLGSRYCDTQKLSNQAWNMFGGIQNSADLVQAICDYANDRIAFGYEFARCDRTASEANDEGIGVCRDFAHLAITLCRCMNIPARYCTGYLGDIGVPLDPAPMDFSAWFEVYLDGRWYTFDARHNKPRIGRVLIARGRDAADVAISTTFGSARLTKFEVVTLELAKEHGLDKPLSRVA